MKKGRLFSWAPDNSKSRSKTAGLVRTFNELKIGRFAFNLKSTTFAKQLEC